MTAWTILKERFQNDKLIIHNHIRSLFEFPVITKENVTILRKMVDEISKNLRVLESFKHFATIK